MKIKQIINEDTSTDANNKDIIELKKYFQFGKRNIKITPNGLNVTEMLRIKKHVTMPEMPVKLNRVSNLYIIEECGLASLNNFPNFVNDLAIRDQSQITSLASNNPIKCKTLDLSYLSNLKNLENFPFEESIFTLSIWFSGIENLDGINIPISNLNIADCENLSCDLTKYSNITDIRLYFKSFETLKVPLAKIMAFGMSGKPKVHVDFMRSLSGPLVKQLESIDRKPENLIKFMRVLKDAGYPHLARLN